MTSDMTVILNQSSAFITKVHFETKDVSYAKLWDERVCGSFMRC